MIQVVTPPASEPVDILEMLEWSRLGEDDQLQTVASNITAAREEVEEMLSMALLTQTLKLVLDKFPASRELLLPKPPLQSVTSITCYLSDDTELVMNASDYIVDTVSMPGRVILVDGAAWPSGLRARAGVEIVYVAGYSNSTAVPMAYKQAIKLLAAHYYENREAVIVDRGASAHELPFAVRALLGKRRLRRF